MSISEQRSEIGFDRLDTPEAALFVGCSQQTLRLSRHTGMLFGRTAPPYIKMGRMVRYERWSLEAWLSQFEEQTNTAGGKG